MAGDVSRDLVPFLSNITLQRGQTKTSLLSEGIEIFIDSRVPEIWLPRSSCALFEHNFGLVYNTTIRRYIVNDSLHNSLQLANPSVSLLLQDRMNSTGIVNITLPYGAFDLELGYPHVNGTQRYFPLRQAENATQYTFGRTFLQEA